MKLLWFWKVVWFPLSVLYMIENMRKMQYRINIKFTVIPMKPILRFRIILHRVIVKNKILRNKYRFSQRYEWSIYTMNISKHQKVTVNSCLVFYCDLLQWEPSLLSCFESRQLCSRRHMVNRRRTNGWYTYRCATSMIKQSGKFVEKDFHSRFFLHIMNMDGVEFASLKNYVYRTVLLRAMLSEAKHQEAPSNLGFENSSQTL